MKYAVGDLVVDVGRQSVSRAGIAIPLPKLSYQLLLVLIRHAPNVVSLNDLLNEVWRDLVVSPDTVSKRVLLLRSALGDESRASRYIAVLRGRGYQLIADVSEIREVSGPLAPNEPVVAPAAPAKDSPDEAPTPDADGTTGPVGKESVTPALEHERRTLWSSRVVAVGLVTLLVAGVTAGLYWGRYAHAAGDRSVAVLPFVDLSAKHDEQYLSDGVAEEILHLLTKVPGLTVIGRTSSFQFRGKNEDLRSIGEQLNAAYLLEGSVRKGTDTLRITAQLVDARTGVHAWSETFDGPTDDVLQLEDRVSAAIVRKLELTVAPGYIRPRSLVKNPASYELMLRGLNALDRYDETGLQEASSLFKQAVDRDPTSADAMGLLALTYKMQAEFGFGNRAEGFEDARKDAMLAVQLDPASVWAHHALAGVYTYHDWNWAAARKEVEIVRTLAPGSGDAAYLAGMLAIAQGHWNEAATEITEALDKEPLDAGIYAELAAVQMLRGNLSAAETAARRVLQLSPAFSWGHYNLGEVLLARSEYQEALAEMNLEPMDDGRRQGLAMVYYSLGRQGDSDAALADEIKQKSDDNAFGIAEIYAHRGQPDEALTWLERAYTQKDPNLKYVRTSRSLQKMLGDPRFKEFLRKMNLSD